MSDRYYGGQNKDIEMRLFKYQLTEWLMQVELYPFVNQIERYEPQSYGKYYIVKRHNGNRRFAIFTKGRELITGREYRKDQQLTEKLKEEGLYYAYIHELYQKKYRTMSRLSPGGRMFSKRKKPSY